MPDRVNQISIVATKNLKLIVFIFKMLECCSKPYNMFCVNSRAVIVYQHLWELEQNQGDDFEVPIIDKNKWAKTMEYVVHHLKLVRGVRGVPLAYAVRHHIKVADISLDNWLT